jgi:arginyl-tRNA synthetase
MKQQLESILLKILASMGAGEVKAVVTRVENSVHGEYTTNVAMMLARQLKKSPLEIGLEVRERFMVQSSWFMDKQQDQIQNQSGQKISLTDVEKSVLQDIESVEVVPPGFINFKISEAGLSTTVERVLKQEKAYGTGKTIQGRGYMIEFGDPNTHKAFHIGHLRNITIGESLVRTLEAAGAQVIRASYQGDVGMHIAKCIFALMNIDDIVQQLEKIRSSDIRIKVDFLGKAYASGSQAYEADESVKQRVAEINKQIYAKDGQVFQLYQESRGWSLEYFENIYLRVGTTYKRNYFESEVYDEGKKNVLDGLKHGIFEESKRAVIFPGEKYKLHNRVFITGEGNPTYEGKDMGLGPLQFADLKRWTANPYQIIRVVGPEQAGYFQVVFEAQSQLFPELRNKFHHLIAGWVKLKHGKMSSRTGQVVLGEWLLDEAKKAVKDILDQSKVKYSKEDQEEIMEKAAIAAVKYAFLKVGTNQEIAFDFKESVSFNGDSGPYLQYTYARCKSVLKKAKENGEFRITNEEAQRKLSISDIRYSQFNQEEREVARLIHFFPEVVKEAALNYSPNGICSYLYDLAQAFNLFYQKHPILENTQRLDLTVATARVLKNGLYLLGIETLERM